MREDGKYTDPMAEPDLLKRVLLRARSWTQEAQTMNDDSASL